MPIKLTDDDYKRMEDALYGQAWTSKERIYLAGMAAGIERAAKLADDNWWTDLRGDACDAAIRALLK